MSAAWTRRPPEAIDWPGAAKGRPADRAARIFDWTQAFGLVVLLAGLPLSEALKSIGLTLAVLGFLGRTAVGSRPRVGSGAQVWALLAYFVISVLSMALAEPALRRPDGLLALGITLAPFVLVADACRRPGRTRLLVSAVILGCAAAAAESLVGHAAGAEARLSLGSIENPVPAGEYLGACLALSLGLLIGASRSRWMAAGSAIACLLTAVALVLTGSRGPIFGASAGAFIVAAAGLRRRVYAVLLLVGILTAAGWFAAANPESRLSGGAVAGSHGASFRLHTWRETSALIAQRPLIGHGPGTFAELGVFYGDEVWGGRVESAHNVWFHTACESGLLGAGALAVFLVLGTGAIARNIRRGRGFERAVSVGALGAVITLVAAGIFSVTTDAEPGMLLFALLALGQGPSPR